MPGLNLLLRESLRNRREQLRRQSSHSSSKRKMHAAGIARGAQSSALPLPREQQGDQQLKPLQSNRRKSPMTGTPGLPLSVAAPCACARVSTGLSAAQRSGLAVSLRTSQCTTIQYARAHIYIRATRTYVRGAKRRAHLYLSLPYRSGDLRLRTRRRSPCQRWLATGSGAF